MSASNPSSTGIRMTGDAPDPRYTQMHAMLDHSANFPVWILRKEINHPFKGVEWEFYTQMAFDFTHIWFASLPGPTDQIPAVQMCADIYVRDGGWWYDHTKNEWAYTNPGAYPYIGPHTRPTRQ